MTDPELVDAIGVKQGLASAALFRTGEIEHPEAHTVWLDGRHGSFLLSTSGHDEVERARSWAWSSGVPHHVGIVDDTVTVLRWDTPESPERYDRRAVLERPNEFYGHLCADRVQSDRNIVAHCLSTFRKVRNLVHHYGIEDARSLDAYLALLAHLCSTPNPSFQARSEPSDHFDLPDGATALLNNLPQREVEAIIRSFSALDGSSAHALPRLAVRHASGDVFQEAHFELVSQQGPDLFAETPPARGKKPTRGGVHFTPPYLARSLAEEAISRLGDLAGKHSLEVMDIACGSGAFLVECLRALERKAYAGHVRVIGRDISPTAIHMARFVVGLAAREWPGPERHSLDVRVGDALREPLPSADVVVVNPPFATGQDIDPESRETLRRLLSLPGGHLDLSMGFLAIAASCIRTGGALAALMPAKLLEAEGARPWRRNLADGMNVALKAVFSDVKIFERATVRIGAVVLVRGEAEGRLVDIRTGARQGSTGDALRALRRDGTSLDSVGEDVGWALRVGPSRQAEAVTAFSDGHRSPDGIACAVTDLFDVREGMRPGSNRAFVRTEAEMAQIPKNERIYFRSAITSKGIRDGAVSYVVHVFYPFREDQPAFRDELHLRETLPFTYARHLVPFREALAGRKGRADRWWLPTHHAPGLVRKPPALISKYFASPGGFTIDRTGECTVHQGFGWQPTGDLVHAMAPTSNGPSEMALAYLAVLNSAAFFRNVTLVAPAVSGGQLDMSQRYMRSVPLMDLSKYPEAVPDLAGFSRRRYLGSDIGGGRDMAEEEVEGWSIEKLAQARSGRVFPSHGAVTSSDLPSWARWLVRGAHEDAPPVRYVDVIEHLQDLSMRDDLAEVDAVLGCVDVQEMSEQSLITLARTTFGYRSRLPHWMSFRERAERALDSRGRPARKVLVGLYK